MSVIFIALPVALLLGAAGMIACAVCVHRGQYDDLETAAVRLLIDDKEEPRDD